MLGLQLVVTKLAALLPPALAWLVPELVLAQVLAQVLVVLSPVVPEGSGHMPEQAAVPGLCH